MKKVFVQADAPFRTRPEDLDNLYVRGSTGNHGAGLGLRRRSDWIYGPTRLERYNGLPPMEIQGSPAPGESTGDGHGADGGAGQAAAARHRLRMDRAFPTRRRRRAGAAGTLYALSLLVVFLCLAALYESWSVPIAVLLVVPLGVVGALIAAHLTRLDNDIYFQVGLITTIGVSAKNAILIVEFAEARMKMGMNAAEAALAAAKLRLRPILMTSFAFIFGVLPLAHRHRRRLGRPERHRPRRGRRHDLGDRAGDLLRAGVLHRGEAPVPAGRGRRRPSRPPPLPSPAPAWMPAASDAPSRSPRRPACLAGCIDLAPAYHRPAAADARRRFPTGPAYPPAPAAGAAGRSAGATSSPTRSCRR